MRPAHSDSDAQLVGVLADLFGNSDRDRQLADRVTFALSGAKEPSIVTPLRRTGRLPTITFAGDEVTVMIAVNPAGALCQVNGWVAPATSYDIEARVEGHASVSTVANELGRFDFDHLPCGLTQLLLRRSDKTHTIFSTPATDFSFEASTPQ